MGLSCWRYKCYDFLKRNWISSRLFYYGKKFEHLGPICIEGTVFDCVHSATDGDVCFDLSTASGPFHCELTPCESDALHAQVKALKIGQRVQVKGTKTFDPPHHIGPKKFTGGGNEVHPVTEVTALTP